MKKTIALLLALLLTLSLLPAAMAESGGEDALSKIRASAHMKLADAEKLLKDAPENEETKALRTLVADLMRCEDRYIQEKDEGEYETYTAKLEIWLEKGEPRCSVDYENYIGMLYRYPAPIERAEDPWLFHTEPSDGEQTFLIDFNADDMHITWGDGVCDYMLHRWSGDPKELENTPFEETEDYAFVVSLLKALLPKDAPHRIDFDEAAGSLSMYFCDERLPRRKLLQNVDLLSESLASMEGTMETYSEEVQAYLNICLSDSRQLSPGASCVIAWVDRIREDGRYEDEDLIIKAQNGRIVYSIARNAKKAQATPQPAAAPTAGEKNALRTARQYLEFMPFSYTGLIEQLEYEGYTHSQAVYGADHCGANWKSEAARMAENYLKLMAFSYSGLVEQLEYEGFTHEQAVYGADRAYH